MPDTDVPSREELVDAISWSETMDAWPYSLVRLILNAILDRPGARP